MRLVSAHDLQTGAAFVLPGNVRCVREKPDSEPTDARPLASCNRGSVVFVEWQGSWVAMRVVST